MNILRGMIATIFILIFSLAALLTTVGIGLERALIPQTAAAIIEKAKAGERLTAALPGLIKQGLSGPNNALLSAENIQRFVAESLPAAEADSILRSVSGEVVSYIRGERDTISKVDLAPTETRAVAAAKKIFPGKVGAQFAVMVQAQFKAAGLDKGLEIPRAQLDAARNLFSQFRLGEKLALCLVLLLFLLIFAVAPHGLRGRLRWCAAALVIVGCLSAAVAACALTARSLMAGLPLGGNTPPEIQSLIKDAVGALGGVLGRNIFIAAAVYAALAAALIVLNLILRKRNKSSETAPVAKK